ncbi:hypothetical protein [Kitasatospora camelliae]|uniref:Uncharacterized protein n=1 Tax=Kitasatospora camelliae TaxID=3156397 RepID=A0AAU8JPN3_9ACTN
MHDHARHDHERQHLLELYLNDHLAAAYGGAALARRIARTHPTTTPDLWRLAREVTEDRDTLVQLMNSLGVQPRRHRMVAGAVAERVGRVKLNGRIVHRSPLSDVLELEAMRSGVQGKLALWRALRRVAPDDDRMCARLDRLEERARHQAELLDAQHAEAAERSLSESERAYPVYPPKPVAGCL